MLLNLTTYKEDIMIKRERTVVYKLYDIISYGERIKLLRFISQGELIRFFLFLIHNVNNAIPLTALSMGSSVCRMFFLISSKGPGLCASCVFNESANRHLTNMR